MLPSGTSGIFFLVLFSVGLCNSQHALRHEDARWTDAFGVEMCRFSATGENRYFVLKPGYVLELRGIRGHDTTDLVITVLGETRKIGPVEARVVEEMERHNGALVEISRNFYAVCPETNSVFYFGEEVDTYKGGKVVGHEGAWRADAESSRAGLMMPGILLEGSRYYQEFAPQIAMDRAEITSTGERVETPAGTFHNCLCVEETTPLEPRSREYKFYAPGIGLVKDGDLLLTKYGFR